MKERRKKKRRLNRKQVVWIERASLAAAAILVVAAVLRLSVFRNTPKSTDPSEAVRQEGGTETEQRAELKNRYLFSFAGDCTIGSLLEWQGSLDTDFQSVVGEDYAYPLSGVRQIFEADDFTTVNLEGTFTRSSDAVEKPYRFRADPAYVRVLSEGGVEAVSTANNHSRDFGEEGRRDTLDALDSEGILHTDAGEPLICELEGGLTIGIVSCNTVDSSADEAASVRARFPRSAPFSPRSSGWFYAPRRDRRKRVSCPSSATRR